LSLYEIQLDTRIDFVLLEPQGLEHPTCKGMFLVIPTNSITESDGIASTIFIYIPLWTKIKVIRGDSSFVILLEFLCITEKLNVPSGFVQGEFGMKYRIETALIEIVPRKIVSIVIQGKAQVVEFSSKITTKNTLIDLGCLIVCYFGDGWAILN